MPFLAKIRKFKMAAIFGEGKIFGKLQRLHSLDTLWVENFDEIALSGTVKEIEANLCFDTLWVENFDEIALSGTVKEIEANLCFHFWQKFENWPPFLGRGKFFFNYQEYNAQIPCGSKILTKSLYLARLRR